jgi:polyhydroxybutyrate depolymerase
VTPPAGSSVKTTRETMSFNGATRKYILSVPLDYDASRAYPLVMEFHGNPGTADFMLDAFPFDGASKGDAIVVYPNAAGSDWDLYNPTDQNPDMGYVKAVIDELASKYTIDKQRVLGFGWSGGAFFVNQLACRFPGLFRAIASHAGGAPDEPSVPNVEKHPNGYLKCAGGPIATFVVHGDKDNVVVPGSGEFAAMYWAYVNGCGEGRSDTTPSPCRKYDGCPASAPVHLCMIPGLGHPLWSEGQAASWGFFRDLP